MELLNVNIKSFSLDGAGEFETVSGGFLDSLLKTQPVRSSATSLCPGVSGLLDFKEERE